MQQALGFVRCDGFWDVGKHDHHNFKIQSVQAHGRTRGGAILTIILWSKHQYRTNIWIIAIAMIKFSDWESIFHPWHPPSSPSSCHQTCFCNPIPENAKDLPRHIPDCRLHLLCWSPCYPHLHPFRTQGTISLIIILHHFLPSSSALHLRRWISKILNKSIFQKRETVIKELSVLPESEHLKRPKLDTVGWGNGIHFRKRPSKDAKKWKKDKLFQVKCHRILKHSCNIFCVCSLPCGLMFRNPGAIKAIVKPQTQYCLAVKREFESDQYSANVPILCKNEWMSQLCFLEKKYIYKKWSAKYTRGWAFVIKRTVSSQHLNPLEYKMTYLKILVYSNYCDWCHIDNCPCPPCLPCS